MRPNLATALGLMLVTTCAGIPGCASPSGDESVNRLMQVKEAPEPPPARAVPIDADLVARADRTVRETLESSDPLRRANAVEAAEQLPREEALDLLATAISDTDPRVRFAAAVSAGRLRAVDLKPQLEEMAEGTSPNGRVAATYALHRLGDMRRSRRLEQWATDGDEVVRSNTAFVLGLLDEPSARNVLEPMLADPDPNVRLNAAEALWRHGDPKGFEALLSASISMYADDRVLGVMGMGVRMGPDVPPALEGKLVDEYPEVSLAAARALGSVGSDRGFVIATNHLSDKDARRRLMAAMALGEIGRPDAQPRLEPLLKDSDPGVRLAAADAVLSIARHAEAGAMTAGEMSQ